MENPTAPAPAVAPEDDRSSLLFLEGDMRAARDICDARRFAGAKQRLLATPDRMIAEAGTTGDGQALRQRREQAAAVALVEGCPEPVDSDEINVRSSFYFLDQRAYGFGAYGGIFSGPTVESGFTRDGLPGQAPEEAAGETEKQIGIWGLEGLLNIPSEGKTLRIEGGVYWGMGDTEVDVPAETGRTSGTVFGALSPGQSSGNASPFAISGVTETEIFQLNFGGRYPIFEPGPNSRFYLALDYSYLVRDYRSNLMGAGTSNNFDFEFSQMRDQQLDENFFGIGIGGETHMPINVPGDGGAGVSVRLAALVEAYVTGAEMDSFERNIANFGPLEDRNFTIQITDQVTYFGVLGGASAGLMFGLSPNLVLTADRVTEYRTKVGAIRNPGSGDEVFFDGRTTEFTTGDSWSYGARIRLIWTVGQ